MNHELKLRAVEPEDADMMYEIEAEEDAWIYSDYLAPISHELLKEYALTYDADPFRSGQLRLIIEAEGEAIGLLDLFDISPRHLRADTGIYILHRFRGKGLGVKAIELVKVYSRNRLGLHQLTATVARQNEAARRCYNKAGFECSGSRVDWLRIPDGWVDVDLLYCRL
ncbi:MAG: GNAT family N-acetyltransferase [Muribaculaceae bacterium]|nr:GNAT family N-acetyltransferase [Muribaculaceae bacterium]